MQKYNFNNAKYGSHKLIANELGSGKLILDVGCNKGYLYNLAPNNIFYGIDYNGKELELAKTNYEEVYRINLNNYKLFKVGLKFDVIIFADILEHLIYPEQVLRYFVSNYLKKTGKVILSLPNIANFSIRISLLFGKFNYTESGILDKTHLHLYTLKSAKRLIESCSLSIKKEKFSSNHFGFLIKRSHFLGSILGFNIILTCKR